MPLVRKIKLHVKKNKFGLGLITATWAIFFGRLLSGTKVYFLDDLKIIFYPLEHIYTQFQHNFELPLWSNLFGFGQPLLSWGQLGFFTPVHVILRALHIHPLTLLQVSVLSYFALGLLGMYSFLRHHKLKQLSAALGSVVFIFSGFNIGHLNHVNFYSTTMVLPWLLLAIAYLFRYRTTRSATVLGILGAIMIVSGHPQATLYSFIIATIYGLGELFAVRKRPIHKMIALTILASALALGLSSLMTLPLLEFVPLTERAGGIPDFILYEFSYPPWHAITLILPYFFGDHQIYWGAKGFQELAAFVGIIPLVLSALAITVRRQPTVLRTMGTILVVAGTLLALGRFSPLYRLLVEQRVIASLAIPGRFVFLFTTGIALLSAVGLHTLLRNTKITSRQIKILKATTLAIPPILLMLVLRRAHLEPRIIDHILTLIHRPNASLILAILGIVTMYIALDTRVTKRARARGSFAITTITIITLIILSWNYNPLTDRTAALSPSPFKEILEQHGQATGIPARLYSRPNLYTAETETRALPTKRISNEFTVHQPITARNDVACFIIPMHALGPDDSSIQVELKTNISQPALAQTTILATSIIAQSDQTVCFPDQALIRDNMYNLSFKSSKPTGINLYYEGTPDVKSAYFVRVANPTQAQIQQSRKQARVVINQADAEAFNTDAELLSRHVQVTADTSSARWIGALSIRTYREFIEQFLANDIDQLVDGSGNHFIVNNRRIFDMAGITHVAQSLPVSSTDLLPTANFEVISEHLVGQTIARLYRNPTALPKAYSASRAIHMDAVDEVRHELRDPKYDPTQLVYIASPNKQGLPLPLNTTNADSVTITKYTNTRVDVEVESQNPTWLIVTDSTTPQWQTFIDGKRAPYYVANSFFKTALVPTGEHVVSFRYHSPATETAKNLAIITLIIALVLLFEPMFTKRNKK